jgi:hypothetical protein
MEPPILLMLELAVGNPGAVAALADVYRTLGPDCMPVFLALQSADRRGSAIWLGYSDWAHKDARRFAEGVLTRDPALIHAMDG